MHFRLVHSQNSDGALLISDIEAGLPNEAFGFYYKQPVYVPYYRTFFNNDGLVEVDRSQPGFVDLVPSDKVQLSEDDGVIAGLAANGFLSVVEIPTGALDAPMIGSATHDTSGGMSGDDDGKVVIDGTNFTSYAPDETVVVVRETSGPTEVSFTRSEIEGFGGVSAFSDTQITIDAGQHTLGTTSGDVDEVDVTANAQTATSAVSEV